MTADKETVYGPGACCVVGFATPTADTPTAVQYDKLILSVIFERESGIIRDAECNMVLGITSEYISSLLIGRNVYSELDAIAEDIRGNYSGISQKALVVCLYDIRAKIRDRMKQ